MAHLRVVDALEQGVVGVVRSIALHIGAAHQVVGGIEGVGLRFGFVLFAHQIPMQIVIERGYIIPIRLADKLVQESGARAGVSNT